jgi:hypothetical protein
MHYQWMADANPGTSGDMIFEEYDTNGQWILRRYDDGSIVQFNSEFHISNNFARSENTNITFTSEMAARPQVEQYITR